MGLLEAIFQSLRGPTGAQFRLRKNQASGLVIPATALVDQDGNLVDKESLITRALPRQRRHGRARARRPLG